ncbi:MAG TPA: hypothetical protein PK523_02245 [Elusimicrobiales bacterium]|nr:hypothetical protein [Elusimicrobiales bacterium]
MPKRGGSGGGRNLLALLMLLGGAFAAGYMNAERPARFSYGLHGPRPGPRPGALRLKRPFYDAAARLMEHKIALERSIEDNSASPPYDGEDLRALRAELERTEPLLAPLLSEDLPESLASQAAAAAQARREALLASARLEELVGSGGGSSPAGSARGKAELEKAVAAFQHHLAALARLLN